MRGLDTLHKAHMKQLHTHTYLRLAKQPVGLLINFAEGLKRVVNEHVPSASPRLRVNQNRRTAKCSI